MSAGASAALRTTALTVLALLAFAANSLLCRLALARPEIDPASFTTLRLVSGALMLWLLLQWTGRRQARAPGGSWRAAAMLFLYAIAFSFAYVDLHAGVGALILFGTVQTTMIVAGLLGGERMQPLQWLGLLLALIGLAVLLLPGATAPSAMHAMLMALAGLAWGLYSLLGRGGGDPVAATAGNFLRAVPMTLAATLLALPTMQIGPFGMALAIASGALASGLGYVVWYRVLPRLRATTAASAQLAVPVITAVAGVSFLAEPVTLRMLTAVPIVLGGIAMVILAKAR